MRGVRGGRGRRPYGPLLDLLHHHIGSTHVVHHIDHHIPHYRAVEATRAVTPCPPRPLAAGRRGSPRVSGEAMSRREGKGERERERERERGLQVRAAFPEYYRYDPTPITEVPPPGQPEGRRGGGG